MKRKECLYDIPMERGYHESGNTVFIRIRDYKIRAESLLSYKNKKRLMTLTESIFNGVVRVEMRMRCIEA